MVALPRRWSDAFERGGVTGARLPTPDREPSPVGDPAGWPADREATEPREFELRLPAEAARLIVLRRRLEEFLAAHQVSEEDTFDLVMAVSEAAANAVEHPVEPAEPWITVTASFQPEAVVVRIRDTGGWRPAGDAGFRGRGLALIGALTELSVHRSAGGTEVVLRRPLSRP